MISDVLTLAGLYTVRILAGAAATGTTVSFWLLAFSIFLFAQYYKSIPKSLDEAAMIDGAGWWRIYRSVISPLAGPAFATSAILTFLPQWNSYLWPLLVIQDEELRDNIRTAYESGRSAYARLNNGKAPAKALLDDKKLHKDLKGAADSLRDASEALRAGPKKKKRKGGLGRLLLLAIIGSAIALAVSEDARNKVLDLLFGAEEEFDYTSTTTPSTPAPTETAGAT